MANPNPPFSSLHSFVAFRHDAAHGLEKRCARYKSALARLGLEAEAVAPNTVLELDLRTATRVHRAVWESAAARSCVRIRVL